MVCRCGLAGTLPGSDTERADATPGPTARNKWLVASVVDDADRRDPDHHRTWVALVDGNNHQIQRIGAEARDIHRGRRHRLRPRP